MSNTEKLKLIAERRKDWNQKVSDTADKVLQAYADSEVKLDKAVEKHVTQLNNELLSIDDVNHAIDVMSNAPLSGS